LNHKIKKGKASENNRIFDHFDEAEKYLKGSYTQPSSKILRIVEIWADEEDVDWFILAHNLNNETKELNAVESAAIDLLSICQNGPALNRVSGPNSSFLTPDMVNEISAERVNPSNPYQAVFIFPIQRQLLELGDPYEATRKSWCVKEEYRNIGGAFAVGLANFISRGVYLIDNWYENDENKHEFESLSDFDETELINRNWQNVIQRSMGYWQRGNYLIIEFNGQGQFRFLRGNPDKETWFDLTTTSL